MNDTHFVQRPGGATYRASPLNAAFLDRHESWYAVHWTTPLRPYEAVDYCLEALGLSVTTYAIVQSIKGGITQAPLYEIKGQIQSMPTEYTTLFRLDAHDYVIIWEPSGEYERILSAAKVGAKVGENVPFTGILGFGTDKFDPAFGSSLLSRTATKQISSQAVSIWQELYFLNDEFKRSNINPSRSLND